MTLPDLASWPELNGSPQPRIAPPRPLRTKISEFVATASTVGIQLWPWQLEAAHYITAVNADDQWLYREVAIIVGRQNGKTELLVPLILSRLLAGGEVMHTAQNREMPRRVHRKLGRLLTKFFPDDLEHHGIRRGAGQEEIYLRNGGHYFIVAPSADGPRGSTTDLVVVDELRQMTDNEFMAAAKPTLAGNGQMVYLSNAGTEQSTVLNALRVRAGPDPKLAYVEWSAAPERKNDDLVGWLEANPAIGHKAGHLESIEADYRADLLGGTLADFETERLCRSVVSMDNRLVTDAAWAAQSFVDDPGMPTRAVMSINMDASGDRASAVIAWPEGDPKNPTIVIDVHDTTGNPIDAALLGPDLAKLAVASRVSETSFDPYTDADLARYLRKSKPINGREYANASEKFVRLIAERRLKIHDPAGILAADLAWTVRRPGAYGSYMAVKANDEHTNTAAVAAVRAAWRASAPMPTGPARIS